MKIELDVTGTELVLLYIATGNEDAGRILREAYKAERAFNEAHGITTRKPRKRRAEHKEDGRDQSRDEELKNIK